MKQLQAVWKSRIEKNLSQYTVIVVSNDIYLALFWLCFSTGARSWRRFSCTQLLLYPTIHTSPSFGSVSRVVPARGDVSSSVFTTVSTGSGSASQFRVKKSMASSGVGINSPCKDQKQHFLRVAFWNRKIISRDKEWFMKISVYVQEWTIDYIWTHIWAYCPHEVERSYWDKCSYHQSNANETYAVNMPCAVITPKIPLNFTW